MAGFSKTLLTTKGRNLYAKAQAGTTITFANIKLGSGQLANGQTVDSLTNLITLELTASIQSISFLGDGKTRIRAYISNSGLAQGFYLREVGIFANDPTEGEILYCASNAGDEADFLPADTGGVAVEQLLDIITIVGNATSVTAMISSEVFASALDLSDHRLANPLDHPDDSVTDTKIGNRTITDTVVAATGPDTPTRLWSKLGYMIKAITGKSNWYTGPALTIEAIKTKFGVTGTGHAHTGADGDGSKIAATGLVAGAADDTAIGNRTITDTVVAATGAGALTNLLSKIGYMLKSITGKSAWYTAPATTLEAASTHAGAAAPHSGHETPAGAQTKVNTHANRTDNPHGVKYSQLASYILIVDEKPSGTDGGTFAGGAWRTRVLNTVKTNDGNTASLSNNQITLPAGTYTFDISAPSGRNDNHIARLQNITDSTTIANGTSENCWGSSSGDLIVTRSIVKGKFVIASSKVFEVQHYSELNNANVDGFGQAGAIAGVPEIYTVAEFRKIA